MGQLLHIMSTVKVEILSGIIFGDFRPKTGSIEFKLAIWLNALEIIYWQEFNLASFFSLAKLAKLNSQRIFLLLQ